MVRNRTVSNLGHVPKSNRRNVPSLVELRREGRAAGRRIAANETIIQRATCRNLVEWFHQAERLGLRGKEAHWKHHELADFCPKHFAEAPTNTTTQDAHRSIPEASGTADLV